MKNYKNYKVLFIVMFLVLTINIVIANSKEISVINIDLIKVKLTKKELQKLGVYDIVLNKNQSEKIKENWEKIYNYAFLTNIIDSQSFLIENKTTLELELNEKRYFPYEYMSINLNNKIGTVTSSKYPIFVDSENLGVFLEITPTIKGNEMSLYITREEKSLESFKKDKMPKFKEKNIENTLIITNNKPYLLECSRKKNQFEFYFITANILKEKMRIVANNTKNKSVLFKSFFVKIAKKDLLLLIEEFAKDCNVIDVIKYPPITIMKQIIECEKSEILESPSLISKDSDSSSYQSVTQNYLPASWTDPKVSLSNDRIAITLSQDQAEYGEVTDLGLVMSCNIKSIFHTETIQLNFTMAKSYLNGYDNYDCFCVIKTENTSEKLEDKIRMPRVVHNKLSQKLFMQNNKLTFLNRIEKQEENGNIIYYMFGKAIIIDDELESK